MIFSGEPNDRWTMTKGSLVALTLGDPHRDLLFLQNSWSSKDSLILLLISHCPISPCCFAIQDEIGDHAIISSNCEATHSLPYRIAGREHRSRIPFLQYMEHRILSLQFPRPCSSGSSCQSDVPYVAHWPRDGVRIIVGWKHTSRRVSASSFLLSRRPSSYRRPSVRHLTSYPAPIPVLPMSGPSASTIILHRAP